VLEARRDVLAMPLLHPVSCSLAKAGAHTPPHPPTHQHPPTPSPSKPNAQKQVCRVGKRRLVLDLSCRKRDGAYHVVTDRWQRFSTLAVNQRTLEQLAGSCDEFLVHGVDVEGMQLGIDDELVELLGRFSPIPVTYAGGARTLVSVCAVGFDSVLVGVRVWCICSLRSGSFAAGLLISLLA